MSNEASIIKAVKLVRKLIVLVIGLTVLLLGLVMIVAPGPAIVVIPVGLAILGTEFIWARKILRKVKNEGGKFGSSLLEATHLKGKKSHDNSAA